MKQTLIDYLRSLGDRATAWAEGVKGKSIGMVMVGLAAGLCSFIAMA